MTTIAYRDGVVAADGRGTNNGWVLADDVVKLHRMSDGSVLALLGDSIACGALQRWAEEAINSPGSFVGAGAPPMAAGGSVVVIQPGSKPFIEVKDGGWAYYPKPAFYAWGSGAIPAIVAMKHAGKTAAEAVAVSAEFDGDTGGPILEMRVG